MNNRIKGRCIQMKIYSTGILSFLATVVALLANTQLRQNFDMEYPILFISGQVLFWSCFLVLTIYIFKNWGNDSSNSKWNLFRSVIVCISIYCIAYTKLDYAFLIILIVGITHIYFIRKKFDKYRT